MSKKGRKVTECYAEILDRLERIEDRLEGKLDKMDDRLNHHSNRLRSLEQFRAFTRGSVAVCITAIGMLGSYITGIFK